MSKAIIGKVGELIFIFQQNSIVFLTHDVLKTPYKNNFLLKTEVIIKLLSTSF